MRKIWMSLGALLSASLMIFSGAVPANAAIQTTGSGPMFVYAQYGDTFDYTYSCTADGQALTYGLSGQFPAGFSVDPNTGQVTGAIQNTGRFEFSVACSTTNSSTGSSVYLVVVPRSHAFLHVTPLNDENCSVRMSADLLPNHEGSWLKATVNGSVFYFTTDLYVPNYGSESYTISYDNILATTLDDGTTPVKVYKTNPDNIYAWELITPEDAAQIQCGSAVSWEYWTDFTAVGYEAQTVTATRGSAAQTPGKPFLKVSALNDADCSFLVEGYVPNTPDAGSVTLKADQHNGASQDQAVLSNVQVGEPFKLKFSSNDAFDGIEAISGASIASAIDPQVIHCKTATDFYLSYSSAGTSAPTATVTNLKATTGTDLAPIQLGATPSVKAEFTGGSDCNVHLSGYFPYTSLGVTNRQVTLRYDEGDGVEVFEPTTIASDGFYEIDYSMNSVSNSTYNFVSSNGGEPTCGQGVTFKSSYTYGVDTLAQSANIFVYAGASTPCAAGTYSATGNVPCAQADPGFFVADAGSQMQLPCSAGYFAANYGSTACTAAPAGSKVPVAGMSLSILCPAGTYSAVSAATECTSAPLNFYTRTGAISAVACPLGTHTESIESTSSRECLPNIVQKINLKSLPVGLKFSQTLVVSKRTSAGLEVEISARGKCSIVSASSTTWKIVAGKVKGTCEVLIASRGAQGINEFALTKTLKISKTGK